MVDERSAGAVVFIVSELQNVEYLLLHYTAGHWDFPKGNIEFGEDEVQTALREIREETGLQDIEFLPGFSKRINYRYRRGGKLIQKEVSFYLAKTKTREIRISNEHIAYAWAAFEPAMQRLTYKNAKNLLKEAKNAIEKIQFKESF